jgi:hypothetical protein
MRLVIIGAGFAATPSATVSASAARRIACRDGRGRLTSSRPLERLGT